MQRRMPENTDLQYYDSDFGELLQDAVAKLVRSSNPRRARRIAGLLNEFRDAGGHPALVEFYARLVGEAFLDSVAER